LNKAADDHRPVSLEKILLGLQAKFGTNLTAALPFAGLAQQHEVRSRRFGLAREFMAAQANQTHQKELALKVDEVFGDFVCALYLAYCGMDVPARMLVRRALELTLVIVSCWDRPAEYWAWQTHDEDVSFTKIHQYLFSSGYKTFLEKEGVSDVSKLVDCLTKLQSIYSDLSNVVHPKPYNFETDSAHPFVFSKAELEKTLSLIGRGQTKLLQLLIFRFPDLQLIFDKDAPYSVDVSKEEAQ
jgi:hypothetical protein